MIFRTIILAVFLALIGTGAYAADCNSGGRYEDIGDGTVQDCRTGLIWLKNANCTTNLAGIVKSAGYLDWYDAMTWVTALGNGSCGLTDNSSAGEWRLPTKTEWMAMIAYAKKMGYNPVLTNAAGDGLWTNGDAFDNLVSSNFYWTNTSYIDDITHAWIVHMPDGNFFITDSVAYVWPVRGGQSGTFDNLIIQ